MDFQEGQTATHPKTGQKVIFRGGQWVSAGAGPAPAAKPSAAEIKQGIINRGQLSDLMATEKQVGRVKQLYDQDFKGVGPGSLLEYLPTPQRKRFDSANTMLSTMMKPLIRAPGEGPWTDADQARLDSLVLGGGRQDADNEERLRSIDTLLQQRKAKHSPAGKWKVTRVK